MGKRAGYRYKKKSIQKTFRKRRYATPSRALASHNYMTKVVSDQFSVLCSTAGNISLAATTYGVGLYNYLKTTQFWTNLVEPAGASGISNTFNKMRIRKIQFCYCPAIYHNQTIITGAGIAGGAVFELALLNDRVPTSLGVAADYNLSLIDNRVTFNQNNTSNQWATFYVPKNTCVTTTGYPALTQDWIDTKFVSASSGAIGGLIVAQPCTGSFTPTIATVSLGVMKILITCDFKDFE